MAEQKISVGKFINNLDTEDLTSEKLQGVVNNTYARAIIAHKKATKKAEDNLKDKDKETVEFVKSNHDRLKAHRKQTEKEIDKDDATAKEEVAKDLNEGVGEDTKNSYWATVKKFQGGDRKDKDSVLKDLGYDREDRERLKGSTSKTAKGVEETKGSAIVESKLSQSDKDYLRSINATENDIKQIEYAIDKTVYKLGNKRISAKEAREILGDEKFLSGLNRSAFHWTASRDDVYFDSSKIFKESKQVNEDSLRKYNSWQITNGDLTDTVSQVGEYTYVIQHPNGRYVRNARVDKSRGSDDRLFTLDQVDGYQRGMNMWIVDKSMEESKQVKEDFERKLEPGDKIIVRGTSVTIGDILDQYFDKKFIDIEFKDDKGNYRTWKSDIDGGKVVYKESKQVKEALSYEEAKEYMASKGLKLPKDIYNMILELNNVPNDMVKSDKEVSRDDVISILGIEEDETDPGWIRTVVGEFNDLVGRGNSKDNIWLADDFGSYVNGEIIDKTKNLIVVESKGTRKGKKLTLDFKTEDEAKKTIDRWLKESKKVNEDWTVFEYTSGSNPYIAKTEKEVKRLLRKYGKKARQVRSDKYIVDDKVEESKKLTEAVHDGDHFEVFGLDFSLTWLDHTKGEPDEYAIVCDSIPGDYDGEPTYIGETVGPDATEKEIRELCKDWIYNEPEETFKGFDVVTELPDGNWYFADKETVKSLEKEFGKNMEWLPHENYWQLYRPKKKVKIQNPDPEFGDSEYREFDPSELELDYVERNYGQDDLGESLVEARYNDGVSKDQHIASVDLFSSGVSEEDKKKAKELGHYEIDLDNEVFTRVKGRNWLGNWGIESYPRDTWEEVEKTAKNIMKGGNFKEVSNDEYIKIQKEWQSK